NKKITSKTQQHYNIIKKNSKQTKICKYLKIYYFLCYWVSCCYSQFINLFVFGSLILYGFAYCKHSQKEQTKIPINITLFFHLGSISKFKSYKDNFFNKKFQKIFWSHSMSSGHQRKTQHQQRDRTTQHMEEKNKAKETMKSDDEMELERMSFFDIKQTTNIDNLKFFENRPLESWRDFSQKETLTNLDDNQHKSINEEERENTPSPQIAKKKAGDNYEKNSNKPLKHRSVTQVLRHDETPKKTLPVDSEKESKTAFKRMKEHEGRESTQSSPEPVQDHKKKYSMWTILQFHFKNNIIFYTYPSPALSRHTTEVSPKKMTQEIDFYSYHNNKQVIVAEQYDRHSLQTVSELEYIYVSTQTLQEAAQAHVHQISVLQRMTEQLRGEISNRLDAHWHCRKCNVMPCGYILLPCRHLGLCWLCDTTGIVSVCHVCSRKAEKMMIDFSE
ncbi:hypothetical protein RFI_00091, partial [Reticulomyxa filosa]